MIELTQAEKDQFIQQRLRQYVVQLFHLEMDIVAQTAINNTQGVEYAQAEKAKIALAYAAVEGLANAES